MIACNVLWSWEARAQALLENHTSSPTTIASSLGVNDDLHMPRLTVILTSMALSCLHAIIAMCQVHTWYMCGCLCECARVWERKRIRLWIRALVGVCNYVCVCPDDVTPLELAPHHIITSWCMCIRDSLAFLIMFASRRSCSLVVYAALVSVPPLTWVHFLSHTEAPCVRVSYTTDTLWDSAR